MNRWYFWVLAPVMFATALALLFLVEPPTWQGKVVLCILCGVMMFAGLGLARPRRYGWALRIVAGAILLSFVLYAAYEAIAWWQGKPFGLQAHRAESNLCNALLGLTVFGLPSLFFLLWGRSDTLVDDLLNVEDNTEVPYVEERSVVEEDEIDNN
jgi:hypothetical protein